MSNIGRPKIDRPIQTLEFTTYQEDITLFRNGLIDSLEDEEDENLLSKEIIKKFLLMETWRQNLFIVYLLNKKSQFKFKTLAELLQVDRNDLRREINNIKKELSVL